jgi:hypothetical protein
MQHWFGQLCFDGRYLFPSGSKLVLQENKMKKLTLLFMLGLLAGVVSAQTKVSPQQGGTGIDTSNATGCPTITGGNWSVTTCGSGPGSTGFNAITSGTNNAAAMIVGSGASIGVSGTGTVKATNIGGTVSPGANVTVTGTGTTSDPYVVNSSAAGSGTVNSGSINQLTYYAANGTTVSGNSRATDDTTTLAYSGTGGINASGGPLTSGGTTHGVVIPAGTPVAGAVNKVVYGSDSTNGYAQVNENNTGLSRVCTAANAVCAGGSGALTNITSLITWTGATVTGGVANLSGSAQTFTMASIPGGHKSLHIEMAIANASSAIEDLFCQINGDTGAHYERQGLYTLGSLTATSSGNVGTGTIGGANTASSATVACASSPGVNAGTGEFSATTMMIPFYTDTAKTKKILTFTSLEAGSSGAMFSLMQGFNWYNPSGLAAITSILFTNGSPNNLTGSVIVWAVD